MQGKVPLEAPAPDKSYISSAVSLAVTISCAADDVAMTKLFQAQQIVVLEGKQFIPQITKWCGDTEQAREAFMHLVEASGRRALLKVT